jgi:hypothetical protein
MFFKAEVEAETSTASISGRQGRSQDLDIGGRIIECPETIYGITVKS